MNFVDHTGHIFEIKSHDIEPIGWEYENYPYVFWLNNEYGFNLSINNYYIKPIRFIYDLGDATTVPEDFDISVKVDSLFYKLIGGGVIQNKLEELEKITDSFTINENDDTIIKSELTADDIFPADKDSGNKEYVILENTSKYEILTKNYTYTYKGATHKYTGKVNADGTGTINSLLTEFKDVNVSLSSTDMKTVVYVKPDDMTNVTEITSNFLLITFYVLGYSSEEGTYMTNCLIKCDDKYCPICVGGTYVDEFEELTINARNYGIQLPKDIVRALYKTNFYNYTFNTAEYNEKIKELLMNYMLIKGECGNFNSAIAALKWFGWGDKITIFKLLETDNNFISQYILDDFNINIDTIESYKTFRNSTYISLQVKENSELEETNDIIFDDREFWGEGKPKFENLFDKVVEEKYDEEDISFYKPYYDFVMNELGLKLVALKYYYRKYFLPIHLKIHSASITHQVFANDIKMMAFGHEQYTADVYNVSDTKMTVILPKENYRFYYAHTFNVDANMCHFNFYDDETYYDRKDIDLYAINDSCITIPIKFSSTNTPQYFKCTAVLSKIEYDNTERQIYEYKFNFVNTDEKYFEDLVIYPKLINENFDINYWQNNDFVLYLNVNDVWFTYKFTVKVPELQIEMGTLKYQYVLNSSYLDINSFRQVLKFENGKPFFNSFMYVPQLVEVNNSNFVNELNYQYDISLSYTGEEYDSITDFSYNGANTKQVTDESSYNGFKLYNDTANRIAKYTELYREQISIPSQDKYKNHCITFNIKSGTVTFDTLFNNDGTSKIHTIEYDNIIEETTGNIIDFQSSYYMYDIYLMEDDNGKYIELISTDTKDKLQKHIDLKSKVITNIKLGNIELEYAAEDYKFLVNRMTYVPSNGINHFNTDDIIVAGLVNNDNLPFRLALSSKWSVTPLSVDITDKNEITSQTECAIISIGNDNMQYNKGYYNIAVRYSIDNNIQNQQIKKAKFRVE